MAELQIRNGFMKFTRLGPVKFTEQSRWSGRAPQRQGLWAFPAPYFDMFYAYHKYTDLLPKRYRTDSWGVPTDPRWFVAPDTEESIAPVYTADGEVDWEQCEIASAFYEERDRWLQKVGRRVLPMRSFWYSGNLYTHFLPGREIGESGVFGGDGMDWTVMSVSELAKCITTTRGNQVLVWPSGGSGKPKLYRGGVEHLEVFLAPNMGRIVSNPAQAHPV